MTKETTFYTDLIQAQSEILAISKDENNPFFKSKYVSLSSILREVKPVLNSNGFLLVQQNCIEDGVDTVKTKVIHKSGESIESIASLKIDEKDKNNPQKYGSAVTYMRRYTLTSLLALEEEDDDGNEASANKDINKTLRIGNESEFKRIKDAIELCKNVTEINTLVASEKQNINKLAKYAKDLFIKLKDCKEAMIEILDPAQKESEANLIQGG